MHLSKLAKIVGIYRSGKVFCNSFIWQLKVKRCRHNLNKYTFFNIQRFLKITLINNVLFDIIDTVMFIATKKTEVLITSKKHTECFQNEVFFCGKVMVIFCMSSFLSTWQTNTKYTRSLVMCFFTMKINCKKMPHKGIIPVTRLKINNKYLLQNLKMLFNL